MLCAHLPGGQTTEPSGCSPAPSHLDRGTNETSSGVCAHLVSRRLPFMSDNQNFCYPGHMVTWGRTLSDRPPPWASLIMAAGRPDPEQAEEDIITFLLLQSSLSSATPKV